MFDIGFSELLLIAVVGLIVLGPDKLPGAIRTVSLWIGRFRRSVNQIKTEIEREVGADEIRQQLHNESVLKEIEETKHHLEKLRGNMNTLDKGVREATDNREKTGTP